MRAYDGWGGGRVQASAIRALLYSFSRCCAEVMAPSTDCAAIAGERQSTGGGSGGVEPPPQARLPVHSALDVGRRAVLVREHLGDFGHLWAVAVRAADSRIKAVIVALVHQRRRYRRAAETGRATTGRRRAADADGAQASTPACLVSGAHDERNHGRAVAAGSLEPPNQPLERRLSLPEQHVGGSNVDGGPSASTAPPPS